MELLPVFLPWKQSQCLLCASLISSKSHGSIIPLWFSGGNTGVKGGAGTWTVAPIIIIIISAVGQGHLVPGQEMHFHPSGPTCTLFTRMLYGKQTALLHQAVAVDKWLPASLRFYFFFLVSVCFFLAIRCGDRISFGLPPLGRLLQAGSFLTLWWRYAMVCGLSPQQKWWIKGRRAGSSSPSPNTAFRVGKRTRKKKETVALGASWKNNVQNFQRAG